MTDKIDVEKEIKVVFEEVGIYPEELSDEERDRVLRKAGVDPDKLGDSRYRRKTRRSLDRAIKKTENKLTAIGPLSDRIVKLTHELVGVDNPIGKALIESPGHMSIHMFNHAAKLALAEANTPTTPMSTGGKKLFVREADKEKPFEDLNDFLRGSVNIGAAIGLWGMFKELADADKAVVLSTGYNVVRAYFNRLLPDADENCVMTTAYGIWSVFAWDHAKRKAFEIAPVLHDLLVRTKTRGVEMSWVKLPFQAMLLKFPDGALRARIRNTEGALDEDEALAAIVIASETVDGNPSLSIVLPMRNGVNFYRLRTDVATVDEAIEQFLSDAAVLGLDDLDPARLIRLIINTILYINSGEETPKETPSPCQDLLAEARKKKSSKKRAKLERRAENLEDFPRYILGAGITISHELREGIADEESAYREGRHITCRFMVRGHWRNQAHGARHSERRLMWIRAYWKGPKNAAELVQRYTATK